MSNWFEDYDKEQNTPGEPPVTPPPAGYPPEDAGAEQPSGESAVRPEAPAEPPKTEEAPAGQEIGWQKSESAGYSYTPPTPQPPQPQSPPPGAWGGPYGPPAEPRTPPANSYQPQGGYSPYGWGAPQGAPQGVMPTPPPEGKPPKKRRNKSNIVIAVLASICGVTIITLSVLLALSAGGNTGLPSTPGGVSSGSKENPNAPTLDITSKEEGDGGLSAKAIVNKNLNSTVVITMYNQVQGGGFNFGNPDGGGGLTKAGGATGIVLSADGYIITNAHCVVYERTNKPYARIDVTTYDGTTYENAQVVGADMDTDLAVIKVNAAKLSPSEFGDSSKLAIGDRVVTLGNAGGLEWSASQGIVSGLARDVYEDTGYALKCLQTDAAINPGNSGGPLINDAGQVVGVNSVKIGEKGYEGLGFAIPISEAKAVVDDLMKYGFVKGRVMLGITGEQVDQPGFEGFMIKSIERGSVLENTKAAVNDIITHVGGVRVKTYTEMRSELTKHKVGDTVKLTLMRVDPRTGQTVSFELNCKLGESQG